MWTKIQVMFCLPSPGFAVLWFLFWGFKSGVTEWLPSGFVAGGDEGQNVWNIKAVNSVSTGLVARGKSCRQGQ